MKKLSTRIVHSCAILLSIAILTWLPATLNAQSWAQIGSDIDGEFASDESGKSISMSSDGRTIAIAAPLYGNNDEGYVRIFNWNGSSWTQLGADISGSQGGERVGYSVSLSSDGNVVAIGAVVLASPQRSEDQGRVLVYAWNGNDWVQRGADIVGEANGDQSGHSVSLSSDGSIVAIGAIKNDGSSFKNASSVLGVVATGHVRVYAWNESSWIKRGADIDGESPGDNLGTSVALSNDGSVLAIGAPLDDGTASNAGHVRVYVWNGSSWIKRGADIDGESSGDNSGTSVALSNDGSVVAIGAPLNDGSASNAGHVRIYNWNGSSWTQRGADIDGESASDNSGTSVALSGDGSVVAIGGPENDGIGSNAGHVRIYDWNGTNWTQRGADIDGESGSDYSGYSVSMSNDGNTLAIGSRFAISGNGSVRLFGYQRSQTISGDAGWRMLSIPKSSARVDDISDDTAIQGIAGGDFSETSPNFAQYTSSGSWSFPTNVTTPLTNGYGSIVYFWNSDVEGSSSSLPRDLMVHGFAPEDDVTVALFPSNGVSNGFTLLGNPYAGNFNVNKITPSTGTIQDAIQIWDDGAGAGNIGSWVSASRSTGGASSGNYIVAPWQGFFVETSNTSVTDVTFNYADGVTSTDASATYFAKEQPQHLAFTLSGESVSDKAITLVTRQDASLGWDIYDASKLVPLAGSYATLGFVGEDRTQSVFSLPNDLDESVIIDLEGHFVGVNGELTLSWNGLSSLPAQWKLFLLDRNTGERIDLSKVSSHSFMVEQTAPKRASEDIIPAAVIMKVASGDTRFGLEIQPAELTSNEEEPHLARDFGLDGNYPNPFNPTTVIGYRVGNNTKVQLTIYDMMGRQLTELVNQVQGAGQYKVTWNAQNQASGTYIARLVTETGSWTQQLQLIK